MKMEIMNTLDKVVKSAETLARHFTHWVQGKFKVESLSNKWFHKAVADLGDEVLEIITSEILTKTVAGDPWNYSTQIQGVAYKIVHVLKKGAQSAFIQNCLDQGVTAVQAARLAVAHWVEEALATGVATHTEGDAALIEVVLSAREKRELQLMYCLDHKSMVARKYYPVIADDKEGLYQSNCPKFEKVKISDSDEAFEPFKGDCRGSLVQGETRYSYIRLPHEITLAIVSAYGDKLKHSLAEANKKLTQQIAAGDEDSEIAEDQLAANAKFLKRIPDIEDFLLELLEVLPDCELTASCNLLCARLRNIIGDSMKPVSWLSWKELRAMVRMLGNDVKPLTEQGKQSIYAFVAELFGIKEGNCSVIRARGKSLVESFFNNPARVWDKVLDLKMHERILLYRIILCLRDDLPCDFWIEVDQTSEVLATTSVLLGWLGGMVRTNVAPDVVGYKRDGWSVRTLARSFIKLIATPILYGASQAWKKLVDRACKKLGWAKSEEEKSKLQLNAKHCFDVEGDFGVIAAWASWLTSMMETRNNPEHGYDVHYDGYDLHYDHLKSYDRYTDTEAGTRQDNSVLIESHDLKVVPDTKRPERKVVTCVNRKVFRGWKIDPKGMTRYWPTALVHSMGAQVTQYVMVELHRNGCWFLCIHDAYLVHPNDAHIVTKAVAEAYTYMYAHRKDIVGAFLGSFGLSWDSFLVWVPQAIRDQLEGPDVPLERLENGYNAFI